MRLAAGDGRLFFEQERFRMSDATAGGRYQAAEEPHRELEGRRYIRLRGYRWNSHGVGGWHYGRVATPPPRVHTQTTPVRPVSSMADPTVRSDVDPPVRPGPRGSVRWHARKLYDATPTICAPSRRVAARCRCGTAFLMPPSWPRRRWDTEGVQKLMVAARSLRTFSVCFSSRRPPLRRHRPHRLRRAHAAGNWVEKGQAPDVMIATKQQRRQRTDAPQPHRIRCSPATCGAAIPGRRRAFVPFDPTRR